MHYSSDIFAFPTLGTYCPFEH